MLSKVQDIGQPRSQGLPLSLHGVVGRETLGTRLDISQVKTSERDDN